MATGEREVSSLKIGEAVMQQLRELDHVAYVRFASVYRSFQDLEEFRQEIDRLSAESSTLSNVSDAKLADALNEVSAGADDD